MRVRETTRDREMRERERERKRILDRSIAVVSRIKFNCKDQLDIKFNCTSNCLIIYN